MNLVLRALTLNDRPLSQAIIGCFDAKGGTIGRSDTNTMTLPDPERHISRLQAEVLMEAGAFRVRNAASANAIFVNGRALGPGEAGVLASHDELRIGGYVLGVQIDADNEAVRTITRGRAAVDARTVIVNSAAEPRTDPSHMAQARRDALEPRLSTPGPAAAATPWARAAGAPVAPPPPAPSSPPLGAGINPFADLLAPAPAGVSSANDPFADLFGNPAPMSPAAGPFAFLDRPAGAPAPSPGPASDGPPARLPDDFDPFADPAPRPVEAAPNASVPAVGARGLLASVGAGAGTPASIDTQFGLGPASSGAIDPLAAFLAPSPTDPGKAMAGSGSASTDPLAMFAATPPTPRGAAAAPHAAFNHTPELNAAYRPPQVAPPPSAASVDIPITTPAIRRGAPASAVPAPAGTPPAPAGTAPASIDAPPTDSADALWAAFCEGAGIRIDLAQGLDLGRMRVLGMVMREAAEGMLRLIAVRATAKNELRAAVTTIRARDNNPLKFSPNAQAALEQLLRPPLRGFMTGPDAMQDAMHDLLGHSIGTMAGMRAALAGVLARFEPEELERKLVGTSLMDNLLPMNRKAKLWDLYLQHFGSIRDDAQDDFHNLFGAAFVAAYEDQLDRLKPPADSAAE